MFKIEGERQTRNLRINPKLKASGWSVVPEITVYSLTGAITEAAAKAHAALVLEGGGLSGSARAGLTHNIDTRSQSTERCSLRVGVPNSDKRERLS